MSVQQIPTILKTINPQFNQQQAIKITSSQFNMMKEAVDDYCRTHEAPRLQGILARINRRMKQANNPHLWQTEYELFASSMMQELKEHDAARDDDSVQNIDEIFSRKNNNSMPGHNRHNDKTPILSIFS